MFLAHSTALKSSLAANSQMFSMPMMLLDVGGVHGPPTAPGPEPYVVRVDEYGPVALAGYGSARSSMDTKLER